MNSANSTFKTEYDGFIGLAPYTGNQADRDKDYNFMRFLKHERAIIDHMIASIFITTKDGRHSAIKFGSYDPQAIKKGNSLAIMRTKSLESWAVILYEVYLFETSFNFGQTYNPIYVLFEPQVPYIYIPEKHFLTWAGLITTYYSGQDIECNYSQRGTCFFKKTCD